MLRRLRAWCDMRSLKSGDVLVRRNEPDGARHGRLVRIVRECSNGHFELHWEGGHLSTHPAKAILGYFNLCPVANNSAYKAILDLLNSKEERK